jgi:hypothetical protein
LDSVGFSQEQEDEKNSMDLRELEEKHRMRRRERGKHRPLVDGFLQVLQTETHQHH